jgi:hypothetical protein
VPDNADKDDQNYKNRMMGIEHNKPEAKQSFIRPSLQLV